MLTQRIVVALIVGPVLLIATYLGGLYFLFPILFLMLAAGLEYSKLMRVLGHQSPQWLLIPGIALLLVAAWQPTLNLTGLALFLALFIPLIYCLRLFEKGFALDAALDWFALITGIMLLGWVGGHFFLLRDISSDGWRWTVLALSSIWSADVAAFGVGKYLAGRVLGRHALAPRLSAGKTVEGYVAGIVGGTVAAIAVAYYLSLPIGLATLAGFLVSSLGVFGDLSISLLKREAGLKDSGKLFPGHGGALDRTDSLIWAVAIVYYLVLFLGP